MAFGLARFDLSTITRRLELPEISADPSKPVTLILRFVGAGNRAWEAWMFGRDAAAKHDEEGAAPGGVLAERAANRAAAMEALLAVGLVGWEHVCEDGTPSEFSPTTAAAFLAELMERCQDVLVRAVNFALDRANFRGSAPPDAIDLGKG